MYNLTELGTDNRKGADTSHQLPTPDNRHPTRRKQQQSLRATTDKSTVSTWQPTPNKQQQTATRDRYTRQPTIKNYHRQIHPTTYNRQIHLTTNNKELQSSVRWFLTQGKKGFCIVKSFIQCAYLASTQRPFICESGKS
jgi:hypothetical protein